MNWLPAALCVAPVGFLVLGLIPSRMADRSPGPLGSLAALLAGSSLFLSVVAAIRIMTSGPLDAVFLRWNSPLPVTFGLHVDGVAVVMLALISFIALVIIRFSSRSLRGDVHQGKFFRWISVTLGATLLMVLSRNLVMFTGAWMLTSLGLHQLLIHYPERTWAVWAARKKFLISRLGDVFLMTAVALAYLNFGTTEYTEMFTAAERIHDGTVPGSVSTTLIGILFVLGAMTKSAQFPFHSWLPDTMETPTPVSALMHAGVINAGGFLIIRLSPLVSLSPIALDLLALIGGATAVLGSVVMLTQSSVKRSLAYSTIAQMGFMMLQCGLGAFSAALLHIVAHSAYKAHAFLRCGSVLDAAKRNASVQISPPATDRSLVYFCGAATIACGIVPGIFHAVGIDLLNKPGGVVLGLVLILALTQYLWNAFASKILGMAVRGVAIACFVTVAYCVAFLAMDHVVVSSISHHTLAPSALDTAVLLLAVHGVIGVFALQSLAGPLAHRPWMRALYVHALNGFYIDIPARRLTAWVYGQSAPVP
ncbi:MAG: proton-conducting transporter membrane subunit [Planctomycetota bacterium]|nr:proton-conducting transporter membrane subunit [Planctomycetota bacterium]